MHLEQAHKIGMKIVGALSPACDRIIIAGSIRRDKPEPKDVEIVYIPRIETVRLDMFDSGQRPATESAIGHLVQNGFWRYDDVVKRNGPRYKRMIHEEVIIELFRATRENWGYILALRTGPGEFNKLWASKPWAGGCCPLDIKLQDGQVWRNGAPVVVAEETDFFTEMGMPYWPPAKRNPATLGKWMLDQRPHYSGHKGS